MAVITILLVRLAPNAQMRTGAINVLLGVLSPLVAATLPTIHPISLSRARMACCGSRAIAAWRTAGKVGWLILFSHLERDRALRCAEAAHNRAIFRAMMRRVRQLRGGVAVCCAGGGASNVK